MQSQCLHIHKYTVHPARPIQNKLLLEPINMRQYLKSLLFDDLTHLKKALLNTYAHDMAHKYKVFFLL